MKRILTGIVPSHQMPLIEFKQTHTLTGTWIVWLDYNKPNGKEEKAVSGTYLKLGRTGIITRETLLPTGEIVNVVTIKPAG